MSPLDRESQMTAGLLCEHRRSRIFNRPRPVPPADPAWACDLIESAPVNRNQLPTAIHAYPTWHGVAQSIVCIERRPIFLTAAWPMRKGDQRKPGILQSRLGLPKVIDCAGLNKHLRLDQDVAPQALCRGSDSAAFQ